MSMPRTRHAPGGWLALLLWLVLASPPLRHALEASMSTHMLVQMPLLAAIGFVGARALRAEVRVRVLRWLGGAVPLVLAAMFAASYWMLPRALDAALAEPVAELAKFVSLPLLVGAPLALAWPALGVIGRGFVWTNLSSMLAVTGWLYIAAPVRVCNSYLASAQQDTGMWMVRIAVLVFIGWLLAMLLGAPLRATAPASPRSPRSPADIPRDPSDNRATAARSRAPGASRANAAQA